MPAETKHHIHAPSPLRIIAAFKFLKGVGLLLLAIGALSLLHKDVDELARRIILFFHFDPERRFFHWAIAKLTLVDDRKLKELSAGTFTYSLLLLTEGIGLWMKKTWAEYLTIIATGAFIHFEIYLIFHRFGWGRVCVIAINIAVVWYLIFELRRYRRIHKHL